MTFHSEQYTDSDNRGFVTQTSNFPFIKKRTKRNEKYVSHSDSKRNTGPVEPGVGEGEHLFLQIRADSSTDLPDPRTRKVISQFTTFLIIFKIFLLSTLSRVGDQRRI